MSVEIVPDLRTRSELLASGVTDAEVRRLRRSGEVATLRRGAYCPAADQRLRDPDARHVLEVRRGVVGEFDGRVRYGRLLRPGQEAGDVVHDEKLREDAIRAQDLTVVRWYWPDLTTFAPTAARLRARLNL